MAFLLVESAVVEPVFLMRVLSAFVSIAMAVVRERVKLIALPARGDWHIRIAYQKVV